MPQIVFYRQGQEKCKRLFLDTSISLLNGGMG